MKYLSVLRPHVGMKFAQINPVSNMSQNSTGGLSTIGRIYVEHWLFKLNLNSTAKFC